MSGSDRNVARFFGALLMGAGGLITLLSGACALTGVRYGGVLSLAIGAAFVTFGVWIIRAGLRLFRAD